MIAQVVCGAQVWIPCERSRLTLAPLHTRFTPVTPLLMEYESA
jgi:hypothetical protein